MDDVKAVLVSSPSLLFTCPTIYSCRGSLLAAVGAAFANSFKFFLLFLFVIFAYLVLLLLQLLLLLGCYVFSWCCYLRFGSASVTFIFFTSGTLFLFFCCCCTLLACFCLITAVNFPVLLLLFYLLVLLAVD
jgi:hypothetical protein